MSEVTLGGARLGSGGKSKMWLRNFERSTHDLSYLWKTTAQPGTLIPFMHQLALPGDTHDIDLDIDIMTLPTIGPLFGKFKIQCDVFSVPFRLYNARLHMNELGIGMKMADIKLPLIELVGRSVDAQFLPDDMDNLHTNPSSLLSYFGIRGAGTNDAAGRAWRYFNAIGILGYFDTYKQYYANKQEEVGYIIHTPTKDPTWTINSAGSGSYTFIAPGGGETLITGVGTQVNLATGSSLRFIIDNPNNEQVNGDNIIINVSADGVNTTPTYFAPNYEEVYFDGTYLHMRNFNGTPDPAIYLHGATVGATGSPLDPDVDNEPFLQQFPLSNIDDMREEILKWFDPNAYAINASSIAPYGMIVERNDTTSEYSATYDGEGLAIKTYQSDLFNNWISTEWIDGAGGISEVTAIDVSEGTLVLDELNLAKKVYDMLNRIAVSGGSYDDWLDAVYTHKRQRSAENPVYVGGLSDTLVFQEVVSTSDTRTEVQTQGEPLGTLAGKGKVRGNRKGGKVVVKTDEPCLIIGLFSLTPILDYSQGNHFYTNLKTMDDLHKPSLDQIGFQDLVTDQMAWFDTDQTTDANTTGFFSAGKQPAWINYMTEINVSRGNFAKANNQMFMTLNRRYSATNLNDKPRIADMTTYIDPAKFNYIFADTRLNAQNFWVQIAVNITARRKMSAKVMPNI